MQNHRGFCEMNEASEDALTMWWIDDCFTNPAMASEGTGAFLSLEILHGIAKEDDFERNELRDYGYSGFVLEALWDIAEREHLNLFCASFEYARESWGQIDRKKCLVLVDIAYPGFRSVRGKDGISWPSTFDENTFGVDFIKSMLKGADPRATIVYLTVDQGLIGKWISKNREWLPGGSYPIQKDSQRSMVGILQALVEYFISKQPRKASDWSAKEYRDIRERIYKYCERQDKKWLAHHWPGGSLSDGTQQEHVGPIASLCKIPNGLPLGAPEFVWGEPIGEDIYGVDRPPIRALVPKSWTM